MPSASVLEVQSLGFSFIQTYYMSKCLDMSTCLNMYFYTIKQYSKCLIVLLSLILKTY